jgi:hypothetical protein
MYTFISKFAKAGLGLLAAVSAFGFDGSMASAQMISSPTLGADSYCLGDTIRISFTATGTFDAKNVFTAQLSDASGNFGSNYQNLGSIKSTASGTIVAAMPVSFPVSSTHYRVRVIASSPYIIGGNNGTDISYGARLKPLFTITNSVAFVDDSVRFVNSTVGGNIFHWDFGEGADPSTSDLRNPHPVVYSSEGPKTVTLTVADVPGCETSLTKNGTDAYPNYLGLNIVSCFPSITSSTRIDSNKDADGREFGRGPTERVWVVPGASFFPGISNYIVYAEPGATVLCPQAGNLIAYLKSGAVYTGGGVGKTIVVKADGAAVNNVSPHDLTVLTCNAIDFDYTNAPLYKINSAGITVNAIDGAQIYPNPASTMLKIGVTQGLSSFSLVNPLGVRIVKNEPVEGSIFQYDVSHLPTGVYQLELNYRSSEDTRITKIVRSLNIQH